MFDDNRPKLKIDKSQTDLYVEYLTWGLIIVSIVYAIIKYTSLPEEIPMHFNFSGKVTRYGAKDSIWALNIIGLLTVYGLFYLNKFPHIFNYPKKITLENAKKFYTDATRMLRYLNLCIAVLFSVISFEIINVAIDSAKKFNPIANYIIIGLVVSMTVFPLVYVFKNVLKKKA